MKDAGGAPSGRRRSSRPRRPRRWSQVRGDAEPLALWVADAALARSLAWPVPVPLLGGELFARRLSGEGRRPRPGEPGLGQTRGLELRPRGAGRPRPRSRPVAPRGKARRGRAKAARQREGEGARGFARRRRRLRGGADRGALRPGAPAAIRAPRRPSGRRANSPAARPSGSTGSDRHGAPADPRRRFRPRARRSATGIALAGMEGAGRGRAVRRGEAGQPRDARARGRPRLRSRAPARRSPRGSEGPADPTRQGGGESLHFTPDPPSDRQCGSPSTSPPTRKG